MATSARKPAAKQFKTFTPESRRSFVEITERFGLSISYADSEYYGYMFIRELSQLYPDFVLIGSSALRYVFNFIREETVGIQVSLPGIKRKDLAERRKLYAACRKVATKLGYVLKADGEKVNTAASYNEFVMSWVPATLIQQLGGMRITLDFRMPYDQVIPGNATCDLSRLTSMPMFASQFPPIPVKVAHPMYILIDLMYSITELWPALGTDINPRMVQDSGPAALKTGIYLYDMYKLLYQLWSQINPLEFAGLFKYLRSHRTSMYAKQSVKMVAFMRAVLNNPEVQSMWFMSTSLIQEGVNFGAVHGLIGDFLNEISPVM